MKQQEFKKRLMQFKNVLDYHTFILRTYEYIDKAGRNRKGYEIYGEDLNGNLFCSLPAFPKEFKQWIYENLEGEDDENTKVYYIDDLVATYLTFEVAQERKDKIDNLLNN